MRRPDQHPASRCAPRAAGIATLRVSGPARAPDVWVPPDNLSGSWFPTTRETPAVPVEMLVANALPSLEPRAAERHVSANRACLRARNILRKNDVGVARWFTGPGDRPSIAGHIATASRCARHCVSGGRRDCRGDRGERDREQNRQKQPSPRRGPHPNGCTCGRHAPSPRLACWGADLRRASRSRPNPSPSPTRAMITPRRPRRCVRRIAGGGEPRSTAWVDRERHDRLPARLTVGTPTIAKWGHFKPAKL
jgi:hypothetical protein